MLHEYKNNVRIYFSIEKRHLIKPVEKISKRMIKVGSNKENKTDMFTLYKNLLDESLKKDWAYILVAVVQYISRSYYDIISTHPFKLQKWD